MRLIRGLARRMLAAMFISMEPIAGCSGGTSGKSQRITGLRNRASNLTSPARSASRIIPSHKAMMPTSGSAVLITANSAFSRHFSVTSLSRSVQPPMTTASTISPSQI